MIYITFSLSWPKRVAYTESIMYYKEWNITKNKSFSIQLNKDNEGLLYFGFRVSKFQSHSGVFFAIGLFGYVFMIELSDVRHWDYAKGEWIKDES